LDKLIICEEPWERGGIGRRTALKMRNIKTTLMRLCNLSKHKILLYY